MIITLCILFATGAYFLIQLFTGGLSSDERGLVNNTFSDKIYLDSHVNEKVEISNKAACKEALSIAQKNGWNKSVKEKFFDGGSTLYAFTSSNFKHSVEVFCRWDIIKGTFVSATITIK